MLTWSPPKRFSHYSRPPSLLQCSSHAPLTLLQPSASSDLPFILFYYSIRWRLRTSFAPPALLPLSPCPPLAPPPTLLPLSSHCPPTLLRRSPRSPPYNLF
ncbi:hypothetical protein KC19_2G112500 [Ceratodon purpureus]|uniref:Uncharacterized protein n=1 Tax=Ceratodon purpureus TaxID=3225 RepID=A0A8T0IUE8_CERPU|nr:hypothetical protein KC19_2G112500 [Ceratodon purpureus]